LQLFSCGGYGLALAALALVLFGAHDSYPRKVTDLATHDQPHKLNFKANINKILPRKFD